MHTVKFQTRMDAVQAPIVPVIGGLIRQAPGTISLGQGVVHYGPPQAALDAVRDALSDAVDPRIPGRRRPAGAGRAAGDASCAPRTASTSSRGSRDHGHRRRQHGVHARGARDHRAGRRDHPERAVLLQPRDGDSDGRLHRGAGRHRRRTISCGSTRSRAAITDRTRAIVTVSPNNPSGAVLQRSGAARGQHAVPRARHLSHRRRGLRVLHLRHRRGTCRPARFQAPQAHTIAMYLVVEGLRLRRLADRLHGVSRSISPRRWRRVRTRFWCARRWPRRSRRSRRSKSAAATASRTSASSPSIRDIVVVGAVGAGAAGHACRPPTARSTCC